MNCREAQLLIAPHIVGASSLTIAETEGLETHLAACPTCSEDYRQSERVIRAIRGLPRDLAGRAFSGALDDVEDAAPLPARPYTPKRTIAEGWAELKVLIEQDLEQRPRALQIRRARTIRLIRRAGAIAACVALVAVAGMFVHHRYGSGGSQNALTSAIGPAGPATPAEGTARVVMGTVAELGVGGQPGETQAVAAGELLTAADGQRLRLRIWDRHEITVEPGARLAANRSRDGGCIVALSAGQIAASVNRAAGEGMFRVVTPQATLTVTGTVFTVSTTFDATCLSVTEGRVELAPRETTEHGSPQIQTVSAGQTFMTDGRVLTRVEPSDMEMLLAAAEATKDPVAAIMQSLWYKQRFAPLLHLRDYLTAQGVEVDELTLLAISADPWCIQYPKAADSNCLPFVHRRAGLERAARLYGHEAQWLDASETEEATRWVERGLADGDLVLCYGLGKPGVEVITSQTVDRLSSGEVRPYRFLCEDQPVAIGLARVSKSHDAHQQVSGRQLAEQALVDIRVLLAGVEDMDYLTGQPAVAAWSERWERSVEVPFCDPLLRGLSGVARLGPASIERCARLGASLRVSNWQSSCTELERCVKTTFAASVFEATTCEAGLRQSVVGELRVVLESIAALTSD